MTLEVATMGSRQLRQVKTSEKIFKSPLQTVEVDDFFRDEHLAYCYFPYWNTSEEYNPVKTGKNPVRQDNPQHAKTAIATLLLVTLDL